MDYLILRERILQHQAAEVMRAHVHEFVTRSEVTGNSWVSIDELALYTSRRLGAPDLEDRFPDWLMDLAQQIAKEYMGE